MIGTFGPFERANKIKPSNANRTVPTRWRSGASDRFKGTSGRTEETNGRTGWT